MEDLATILKETAEHVEAHMGNYFTCLSYKPPFMEHTFMEQNSNYLPIW